nr:MAG TPA: hypothetical protein [Caudoviricetes sp.]
MVCPFFFGVLYYIHAVEQIFIQGEFLYCKF